MRRKDITVSDEITSLLFGIIQALPYHSNSSECNIDYFVPELKQHAHDCISKIFSTEIVPPFDLRIYTGAFTGVIISEVTDLNRRNCFDQMDSSELKNGSNVFLVVLFLPSRTFEHPINQAHIQSDKQLKQAVYLIPPKQLNRPKNIIWELRKSLYGLSDGGDHWHNTIMRHIQKYLQLKSFSTDLSMYITQQDHCSGILGSQVEGIICCGNETFRNGCSKIYETFENKEKLFDSFKFAGIFIRKTD